MSLPTAIPERRAGYAALTSNSDAITIAGPPQRHRLFILYVRIGRIGAIYLLRTVGHAAIAATNMRRLLTTAELRHSKSARDEFLARPRRPITVVLDGVTQNYNIGAIFRLCYAFLVQQLVICGANVELHKRRLIQAAQGTQRWVPWSRRPRAGEAVADAKVLGSWVIVAEQTTASIRPEALVPVFPASLVLGAEHSGVSPEAVEAADAAVAIPMLGMANSLNVATAAAILLYWLSLRFEEAART
jgi:tRNA G18 (ribose-2'-O)-methylase SpoU